VTNSHYSKGKDMHSSRFVDRMMKSYGMFDLGRAPYFNPEIDAVSIITPVCMETPGAIDALYDSIERQDYRGFVERIAVCNGAPKETEKRAKERGANVIEVPDAKGYSWPREQGRKAAKGKIHLYMDADTEMGPGLLKAVVKSINDGYAGGTAKVVPDKETCGETSYFNWTNLAGKYVSGIRNIPVIGNMIPLNVGCGQFIYCRSDLPLEWDQKLGTQEDVDFMRQIRESGKTEFLEDSYTRTSGRRFRQDGAFLSWAKKFTNYIKYVNGEDLSAVPEPVLQAA
jgi:glycosyltransferase involved in cell wall biosynthesis